jgi:SAM-dependent methyltransferase
MLRTGTTSAHSIGLASSQMKEDAVNAKDYSSSWIPDEIPLDKPSAARIYDYLLGGYHNFECDRIAVEKILELRPHVQLAALANRAFLRRAIHFLLEQGIDQFLDIGSGIPTAGNVHELVQSRNPTAHVVYVDIDPVAVAHSRAILVENPTSTAIRADLRQPDTILNHPEVRELLNFDRPLGLMLVAVLHYLVDDQQAYHAVRVLSRALVPSSYMVIAHTAAETLPPIKGTEQEILRPVTTTKSRTHEEIHRFFEDFDLVEPGLVYSPLWRPEGPEDVLLEEPEKSVAYVGIGRKLGPDAGQGAAAG